MKKLISLLFTSFLIFLVACGADKMADTKTTKTDNAITGKDCACAATYSPVCGSNGITYDNSCIASCKGIAPKNTVQGNCECRVSVLVCADDGETYNECEARNALLGGYITKITKFSPCGSATY